MAATSQRGPAEIALRLNHVRGRVGHAALAGADGLFADTNTRAAARDFTLTADGKIIGVRAPGGGPAPAGRLPEARMAAATPWEEIVQALRTAEDGRPGSAEVELRPGGELVLTGREQPPQPLSQLPKRRMAAANQPPTAADAELLRRLDPGNAEQWTPVLTGQITGWAFRMTPPFAGQPPFVFFAFRSPSDGNAYRIAVLEPDMDDEYGHRWHMIQTYVGGQRVPVICGPDGRPANNLPRVRTHAAKWMAYTSAQMTGRNPGFSL